LKREAQKERLDPAVRLLTVTLTVRVLTGQSADMANGLGELTRKSASTCTATTPGRVESGKLAGRAVVPESRWVSVRPKPPQIVANVGEQLVGQAAQPLSKHPQPRWQARDVQIPEE
jgi:hypothetical protein